MHKGRSFARLLLAAVFAFGAPAGASVPTLSECFEAGDFIANAALARDNGISREQFMGRLADDFVVIRAFPVDLRWFVKDADDERFLASAAEDVFTLRASPALHRSSFLRACIERLTG